MRAAKQSDWKTEELPYARSTISLNRTFSRQEMQRIQAGLVPEEMEDKWFIYWEDGSLYFHRSWTGNCIYIVRFVAEADGYRMAEADLNRDREQTSETSDSRDAQMIAYLIDALLLKQNVDYPSEDDSDKGVLLQWSQVGRAMLGQHPTQDQDADQCAEPMPSATRGSKSSSPDGGSVKQDAHQESHSMARAPGATIEDRIAGCLLAGALGDAIGAHYEGNPPTKRFPVPAELCVTDDTELTIATCEAIVEGGSVDPESVAKSFLRWYRQRRIHGIGASTLKSFTELDAGGHWALVGAAGERSAGNGAAMRIAPLAFVLDPDRELDRRTIRDVCRITHRNDDAYVGALALLRTIRHVACGNSLDIDFLPALIDSLPDSRVRSRLKDVRDSSPSLTKYARRFAASGYVVDSVPLSILAAIRSSDLMETIGEIVQCGGDTDTIASMFGQIYGAAFGTAALPMDIVNQIDVVALVRETAATFARTAIAMNNRLPPSGDKGRS